jgi:hypothetical protein
LYKENRDSSNYNTKQFAFIIIRGFFQGLFCFMLNIYTLRLAIVDMNGNTADLWFNSLSVFTNVVFVKRLIKIDSQCENYRNSTIQYNIQRSYDDNKFMGSLFFICPICQLFKYL